MINGDCVHFNRKLYLKVIQLEGFPPDSSEVLKCNTVVTLTVGFVDIPFPYKTWTFLKNGKGHGYLYHPERGDERVSTSATVPSLPPRRTGVGATLMVQSEQSPSPPPTGSRGQT